MLTKINRLARSRDFDRVYRHGQRVKIDGLLISYLLTKNEATRLGFVVSKKVSNKANRRNYLKRVLSAVFRELPKSLHLSYDIIIALTRDPANASGQPVKPYQYYESVVVKIRERINA